MRNKLYTACSIFALIAVTSSAKAHAASMDYSALQELFGEPVTTAAAGTPQKASEVATNMTIITQDQIRQSGSRSLATIIGNNVAGMDVLQTGRAAYDVGVRGYQRNNQPRLLVLIDGRQVFIDDYSRTVWEALPVNIDDIKQIEVVKGPSSALFGSNAAGGVVNIITNNPMYDTTNVATVGIGTDGYMAGDATATFKTSKASGIKLSAGGMNEDEFKTARHSYEDRITTDPQRRYMAATGNFTVTPKFQVNTEATYGQYKDTEAALTGNLFGQKLLSYSARAGFSWETALGLVTNNNYFNHTDTTVAPADYLETFDINTDLFVSQLEDQFKIGADHTVRLALEYRNKFMDLSHQDVLPLNPQVPGLAQDNYAAGATWLWNINSKLSWTNALRMDHLNIRSTGVLPATDPLTKSDYSHSINALSANSGLVYKVTDNDTVRATYGRGIQMPSLIQSGFSLDMHTAAPIIVEVIGNPLLKPTIVQNYELGYSRKVSPIFSTLDFAAFYQLNQDISSTETDPTMFLIGGALPAVQAKAVNIGNSHGWGLEVGLNGANKGFRWAGSYSFARVSDSEGVASDLNFRGSAPVHHFRLSGGYTTGKWELDANGQYLTATDMMRSVSSFSTLRQPRNGYITLGGRVGYKVTDNFTIAASGTQLNQARLSANPYPALERQMMLTFSGKF